MRWNDLEQSMIYMLDDGDGGGDTVTGAEPSGDEPAGDEPAGDDVTAAGGSPKKDGDGDGTGDDGGKAGDDGSEPKGKDGPDGAPESYEAFTLPDGYQVDEAQLEKVQAVFKEAGLTQAAAQKLIDLNIEQANAAAAAEKQEFANVRRAWVDSMRADPEIGGKDWDGNVRKVQELVGRVAGDGADEMRQFLNETGYGDHPALFRFMLKIANGMSEDSFPGIGRTGPESGEKASLKKQYPKMPESAFVDK
jgi:hypothetical protein